MNEKRMKSMLAYLPCRAGQVPANMRQLHLAEREGLARCSDDGKYLWTLTEKGAAFVDGLLKAPKGRRFA